MSGIEVAAVRSLAERVSTRLRDPALRRGLALPVALLALWVVVTHFGWVNRLVVVSPEKVVTRAVSELRENNLLGQLGASLRRDLLGFAIGSLAGMLLGGVMALFGLCDKLLGPTFHAAKQVAIFAWVPLLSVWCGTGEPGKVVFIALSAFYPVVLNTYQGIRSVSRQHVDVARAFEFSKLQIIRTVVFPSALPSVFAGLHLGLVYAWLGTIGAEYFARAGAGRWQSHDRRA